MKYLLDTNVISEFTKTNRNPNLVNWFSSQPPEYLFLSALTFGELRRGVIRLAQKDARRAAELSDWISDLALTYQKRILPITIEISTRWGLLSADRGRPPIDTLLAATAIEHNLVLVTRNTKDFQSTGVKLQNPFEP